MLRHLDQSRNESMEWTDETISAFAQTTFETLRKMGLACPLGLRGVPAAIRGFGEFDVLPAQMDWEEPIIESLGEVLNNKAGYEVSFRQRELHYPEYVVPPPHSARASGRGKLRADLKVRRVSDSWLWIEAKTAYMHELTVERGKPPCWSGIERKAAGNATKNGLHTVGTYDLFKLRQLQTADASAIGLLLICFDHCAEPLSESQMRETFLHELSDWSVAHGSVDGACFEDSHPIRSTNGFRERFWFWYRRVKG